MIEENKIDKNIIGNFEETQSDWMPASQTRLIKEPAILWLTKFGSKHGFFEDPSSKYDFLKKMIFPLGNALNQPLEIHP